MKKVQIVGFAPSWKETKWDDMDSEIWGVNELYKLANGKNGERFTRWFEIHNVDTPSKKSEEHHNFLKACHIPIYMQDVDERFPQSVKYPKDEVIECFKDKNYAGFMLDTPYFTNSISYMIALAIYEKFDLIEIYGVDMAGTGEYSYQRPSCEYFIGIAEGRGIKTFIPETSDLLKCSSLYGYNDLNKMRIKMKDRKKELKERLKVITIERQKAEKVIRELDSGANQVQGALEDINFWLTNWVV